LIEDACHALGARFSHPPHSDEAKKLGSLGDAAAFSFFSNKNLATGEGGMVTTNRDDIAESVRLLRSHGMTTLTWDRYRGHSSTYDAVTHGYNYRFNEIGAALGRAQLGKLERNNCRRAELVSRYRENLCGVDHWQVPFSGSSAHSAFHLMVVVAPSATIRNEAVRALTQARIQTSRHYPSIPSLSSFHEFRSNDLSRSDSFASRAITLPLYPALTVQQIDEICSYLCLQPV
jgi:dTDP-4-amino-4,6-dideoxygalactose transaminase